MYKSRLIKIGLSALITAFIAVCAFITVPAPVPFTLQTLGVFVATLFLGGRGGLLSVATYILLGAAGMPVFSGFSGGFGILFGPTGGYILGFLLIPVVYGVCSKAFGNKFSFIYCVLGLLLCYAFGSVWYVFYTDAASVWSVALFSVLPFVLPDILKLFVAYRLVRILRSAAKDIMSGSTRLNAYNIGRHIPKDVGVYIYDQIDSTNTEAVRRIREGTPLPALFVAEKQTAGRGRRGKNFYSDGGGLYMTLALDSSEVFNAVTVTTKASVAVSEALEELTGVRTGIKWVNDIYFRKKKICGILCEAVTDPESGKTVAYIIGVGINLRVKEFPQDISEIAGNLECESISENKLAAKLTNKLIEYLKQDKEYINEYKKRSIVIGERVTYVKNDRSYSGTAVDVDEDGGLVIRTDEGREELLTSGEITLRLY